jgi:hypothetical protein
MSTTRTIAVTGTSEQDAARIAALLEKHNGRLDAAWEPGGAGEADLLIVDIESMYGQMDWLRARSRGRLVVAYTSAVQPIEPEFSLRKPAIGRDLVDLLNRISGGLDAGANTAAPPMRPANSETYEQPTIGEAALQAASEADRTAAPLAHASDEARAAETPSTTNVVEMHAASQVDTVAPAAVVAAPLAEARSPARRIDEWISALGADSGPMRLVHEGLPSIILEPARERWYAGVGLKALAGWSRLSLRPDQIIALNANEFTNATDILPAQPYSRLLWLVHLARGEGELDAGLPAGARYRLTRWPQVEREFPKHFRIATAMMRGTGTLEEFAAQSAAGLADVVDFVNAYNALGYVECEAMLPITMPNDRSGLLERVRKSLRS